MAKNYKLIIGFEISFAADNKVHFTIEDGGGFREIDLEITEIEGVSLAENLDNETRPIFRKRGQKDGCVQYENADKLGIKITTKKSMTRYAILSSITKNSARETVHNINYKIKRQPCPCCVL